MQGLQGRSCKVEFQAGKSQTFSVKTLCICCGCGKGRGAWGLYKARSGFWRRNVPENKSVSGIEPIFSKGLLTEWVEKRNSALEQLCSHCLCRNVYRDLHSTHCFHLQTSGHKEKWIFKRLSFLTILLNLHEYDTQPHQISSVTRN